MALPCGMNKIGDRALNVKNTFIHCFDPTSKPSLRRTHSEPKAFRPLVENKEKDKLMECVHMKSSQSPHYDSDASTEFYTDASESDLGSFSPASFELLARSVSDSVPCSPTCCPCEGESFQSEAYQRLSSKAQAFQPREKPSESPPPWDADLSIDTHTDASLAYSSPASGFCSPTCCPCQGESFQSEAYQRLSAKAQAFQPREKSMESIRGKYRQHFAFVLGVVRSMLRSSEYAANVDLIETADDYSLVIQVHGGEQWQVDRLLNKAKEAILEATGRSKCIYIMGYCTTQPFTPRPNGFDATLGAMENAAKACWHIFKKGFCRHGADCCKQHPVCQVPLQIFVEVARFEAPAEVIGDFKSKVTDIVFSVTRSAADNSHALGVEAVKNSDNQGWTVVVRTSEDDATKKDFLLTLTMNALFNACRESKKIYIMGYGAKPFIHKSNGFVALLGDMRDESKACWDLFCKGACQRGSACRWEHPECVTPISVVIRQAS